MQAMWNRTISGFGKPCHAAGVLTYSNSLDKDSEILTWYNQGSNPNQACTALNRFISSGSDFILSETRVSAQSSLPLHMAPGGGFAVIFTKE